MGEYSFILTTSLVLALSFVNMETSFCYLLIKNTNEGNVGHCDKRSILGSPVKITRYSGNVKFINIVHVQV